MGNPQLCPDCGHAYGRFAPAVSRCAVTVAAQRQLATRVANDRQIAKEQALSAGTWPSVTQQAGEWAKGAAIGYVLGKVWRHVIHRG